MSRKDNVEVLEKFEEWLQWEVCEWRRKRDMRLNLRENDDHLVANAQGRLTAYETVLAQFDQVMAEIEFEREECNE